MLRPLLRWRYLVLVIAAYLFALQHIRGTGLDWRYFDEGSQLLFGQHTAGRPLPGGLQFYVNYPDFQIGPLALMVAAPIRILGGDHARELAVLLMTAIGPALVLLLERTAIYIWRTDDERSELWRGVAVLFGGLLVVQAWANLAAVYAHLDDAIAVAGVVVAVSLVARGRPVWMGIALGAAVAAKPWALVALPLLFAFKGEARWRAVASSVCIGLFFWGPFVAAAPDTLHALQPQVQVDPASVLHLFGVATRDADVWTRYLQLGMSLLLGLIAVLRGRWMAVLLVGIAARVALDPQIYLYYGAGLVVAAFVWDLLRTARPLPVMTLFAFVFLNDAYTLVDDPTIRATMRLILTVGVVLIVLMLPQREPVRADASP